MIGSRRCFWQCHVAITMVMWRLRFQILMLLGAGGRRLLTVITCSCILHSAARDDRILKQKQKRVSGSASAAFTVLPRILPTVLQDQWNSTQWSVWSAALAPPIAMHSAKQTAVGRGAHQEQEPVLGHTSVHLPMY